MTLLSRFSVGSHITGESFIAINGRPGSGKTTLALDLTHHINEIGICDGILLVTESLKTIKLFEPHIPKLSFVHVVNSSEGGVRAGLTNQMPWHRAEAFVNQWLDVCRKRHDRYVQREETPKRYLLILDDCGFDRKRLSSKMMLRVYNNFRQVGVIPMLIMQELFQLHKEGRQNVTHAFTFRLLSEKQHKDLWSAYFAMMDYRVFKSAMKKATAPPPAFLKKLKEEQLTKEELVERKRRGPRGCLVYDGWRAANAESWPDCVFFYYPSHAVASLDWKFGNEIYFTLSEHWVEPDGGAEQAAAASDVIAITEVGG